MGKTRPTYRNALQSERESWSQAERMVRIQHQQGWDEIWVHAQNFADVIGAGNPRDTMQGILLSMCLGQKLEIAELRDRVSELEDRG